MQNSEITPHFDAATEGQSYIGPDGQKVEMSLWLTPQTAESAEDSKERTGRKSYLPIDQIRQERAEDISRIDQEYAQEQVVESEDGLKLGLRVVNQNGSEGTIGIMSAWSTDAKWENVRGQVEALALMHPGVKIVFIETPGMGASDRLTKERIDQLSETGSYMPLAEQISSCLKQTDLQFDSLVGTSEGARTVIALSAELKAQNPDKPLTVVSIDAPGTDKRSLTRFGYGFAVKEGGMQKKVKANSPDKPMVEAHTSVDTPLGNEGFKHFKERQYLPRVNAMRKAGLEDDVKTACASGAKIFDFRSGASAIASAEKAEDFARNIPGYTTITNPNAPHSVIETNPFALSQLVDQALSLRNAGKGTPVDPNAEAVKAARRQVDQDSLL